MELPPRRAVGGHDHTLAVDQKSRHRQELYRLPGELYASRGSWGDETVSHSPNGLNQPGAPRVIMQLPPQPDDEVVQRPVGRALAVGGVEPGQEFIAGKGSPRGVDEGTQQIELQPRERDRAPEDDGLAALQVQRQRPVPDLRPPLWAPRAWLAGRSDDGTLRAPGAGYAAGRTMARMLLRSRRRSRPSLIASSGSRCEMSGAVRNFPVCTSVISLG